MKGRAMNCYECRKAAKETAAVAICECGAGVCLEHARETAAWRRDASRIVGCPHDTWLAFAEARQPAVVAVRRRLVPRLA
ncbi:MAG TPA: DUF2180 family protein [Gaiellaceae bacterium]